jgi:hypothetical protein
MAIQSEERTSNEVVLNVHVTPELAGNKALDFSIDCFIDEALMNINKTKTVPEYQPRYLIP